MRNKNIYKIYFFHYYLDLESNLIKHNQQIHLHLMSLTKQTTIIHDILTSKQH